MDLVPKKVGKGAKIGALASTLFAAFIWLFFDLVPGKPEVTAMLAVAVLMAGWWITEIVPVAVTALIPVALFPLLGIMNGKATSSAYFNHVIFLFIGGFIMALAMEKWNLHKRIALKILLWVGVSPGRILLGFMFATAFLSMWMSNTATTMMMVPIVISIASKLEDSIGAKETQNYIKALLFGVAYSASIGGMATLVGTPPNLSFARIFNVLFVNGPEIQFFEWMRFALPLAVLMFIAAYFLLLFFFKPKLKWIISKQTFREQYKDLGKIRYEEKVVFYAFITLAFLWIFREGIELGFAKIPGWSDLFGHPEYFNDGTVAIFMSIVLFLFPSREKKNETIMDWVTAIKLPWNIVLLFGGGFALATGFAQSGLSAWFGHELSWVSAIHPIIIIFIISFMLMLLTELTSNTATTEMLLPIMAGLAVTIHVNPLLLMVPTTLAASLAFMLPVATPPNAIVFGTNRLTIAEMAKIGFMLNFVGVVLITLLVYFYGTYVFGIDMSVMPDWAVLPK
jgi:sodium-dependent dicarboxylate transporter 2/3/5